MTTVLYIIWALIPLAFFLIWLWSTLEAVSAKKTRSDLHDLFQTFVFVAICAAFTFLIDMYIFPAIAPTIETEWTPMPMFRFLLLPALLYFGSIIAGPKKQIRIEKAPNPTGQGKHTKKKTKR